MLAPFRELLAERRAAEAAVGAFTCYDVTTALGIVRAAEARGDPVILLLGSSSFGSRDGRLLASALLAVARDARVPACVQLDHASDRELIVTALDSQLGAVMADGSRWPLARNTAFVRAIRELADGAGVEAELGHVEGGEDVAAAAASGAFTDPDDAAAFVAATGIHCLAVSIGNVHGRYATNPSLDWERLAAIRQRVDVPLALHGASGLPDADVRRAMELGVAKVNVNTEVRARYVDELERCLPDIRDGLRLLDLQERITAAVADVVAAKLELLSPRSRPVV